MLTAVFRLIRVSWFPFAFSFSSCSKTEIRGISARHLSCWLTQQQSQSTNPNQWKSSASPGAIFIHSSKTGGWYVYIGYWMQIRKLKSEKKPGGPSCGSGSGSGGWKPEFPGTDGDAPGYDGGIVGRPALTKPCDNNHQTPQLFNNCMAADTSENCGQRHPQCNNFT